MSAMNELPSPPSLLASCGLTLCNRSEIITMTNSGRMTMNRSTGMTLRATLVVVGLLWSGCSTWTHAPGYGIREELPRTELVAAPLQGFCLDGLCTLRGRSGNVHFSDVGSYMLNKLRPKTSFRMNYAGTTIECSHPAAPSILQCKSVSGSKHTTSISMALGCQSGTVVVDDSAWQLRTDVFQMAGRATPARELAMFDETGKLLAFAVIGSSHGGYVYGPPSDKAQLAESVELVSAAWFSFMEQRGTPEGCFIPTRDIPVLSASPARAGSPL